MKIVRSYRKYWKTTAFILILGMLAYYVYQVDLGEVIVYLGAVGWKIALIIASSAAAYLAATIAWRMCFYREGGTVPSIGRLFVIRQLGESLTLINPTNIIAGEYSKVRLMEWANVSKEDGWTSIIISRALIITSYFLISSLVLFHLGIFGTFGPRSWYVLVFGGILMLSLIVLSYYLVSRRLLFYRTTKWLFGRFSWLPINYPGLRRLNFEVHQFYKNHRPLLFGAFAFSFIHWILGTMEFYIILDALNLPCSMSQAFQLELGVMFFKSAGGFVPGQLGVEEYGNLVMLEIIGITAMEVWLAVSVLRRFRQLFWLGISSILLFTTYKLNKWKFSA